jgi:pimeloyl-ACP methyl ester carboxylesterase
MGELRVERYDEMGLFRENADEAGLAWHGPPTVARVAVPTPKGDVSALVWGSEPPELVLIHGGAQNAHTWDTVALALDRPLVAIDLPGHGHSAWWDDHEYTPRTMADAVAVAVKELAPAARLVVGMSLGGLTALCLAAYHPDLVRRLVVVDVTPGTDHAKAEPIIAFISGPTRFASFDEILQRTIEHNPTRSESSLRRGVLHNAHEEPDGAWAWRWDHIRNWRGSDGAPLATSDATADGQPAPTAPDFGDLWEAVDAVKVPLTLVRGGASGVVGDEDVVELLRRQPDAEVVVVDGAGHSVQGDKPLELAALLTNLLDG